jgi:hypothetical protein
MPRFQQPERHALVILLLLAGCGDTTKHDTTNHGRFVGHVKTEWLEDPRLMKVLEDFGYEDPSGKLWTAPAGAEVDGASIPQAFWSIIGGPFEGEYRNASVVHDIACDRKQDSWESVHRMFYEACLCGGTDPTKAKVMFAAVWLFGPKWKLKGPPEFVVSKPTLAPTKEAPEYKRVPTKGAPTKGAPTKGAPTKEAPTVGEVTVGIQIARRVEEIEVPEPTPEQVRAIEAYIKKRNPGIPEIEKLDVANLPAPSP